MRRAVLVRRTVLTAVAALTALVPSAAQAQDINGTWELAYTMETPRGSTDRTVVVHLEADGTVLTGTAEMAMMGPPGGGRAGGGGRSGGGAREVEITDGSVDGASFSFTLVLAAGQRSFEMTFEGTIDGDTMAGSVTNPRGGDTPFEGQRKDG